MFTDLGGDHVDRAPVVLDRNVMTSADGLSSVWGSSKTAPATAARGQRVEGSRSRAGRAPLPLRVGPVETVLVAVVGPPGAGKSTVVRALAAEAGLPVFRLREAVRAQPELLAGLAPSRDPLGWVAAEAVRRLLRATFVDQRFGLGHAAVLLDNFPGTAGQLSLLAEIGEAAQAAVTLLELRADAGAVLSRVLQRRVCLACGPDPHAPAVPATDDPERCRSCRTVLSRRDTDIARRHALRLARYAANRPEIADGAAELGIPHVILSADATMSEVCRAAHHALSRMTASATPSGSRE